MAKEFKAGYLNIGAVGPFDVMELLEAFRKRYPKLQVSMSLGNGDEVIADLLGFKTDIAILGEEKNDPRFFQKFYNRHRIIAFVNSDHPWAGRGSISIDEFAGQKMILRTPGSTTRHAFEQSLQQAGIKIHEVMEINQREAMREAVIRGLGIGVVSISEFAPHERLRPLKILNAKIYVNDYVVSLAERQNRPLISAFFATAEELIGNRRVNQS